MDVNNAMQIVDSILAESPMSRAAHARVQEAMSVIAQAALSLRLDKEEEDDAGQE